MSFQSVTIKASPWTVGQLVQLRRDGRLHLPDLQRGFVWTPERVRALLDSLHRRYPVGALLLWKPTWDGLEAPFVTRPWDLHPPDKDVRVQPGSYFVLDGQQRLTSLFRVIFASRKPGTDEPDPALLVALSPDQHWTENPFHLRSRQLQAQLRSGLLVPAEIVFEGQSAKIQAALRDWLTLDDPQFFAAMDRANAIRNAILNAEIVAYEIDAEADDDNVIEIFARLNQQGVRLRPGDLAAARLTGVMKNFRERARKALGSKELAGFSAQEGEEEHARSGAFIDTDLLVRTAMFLGTGTLRFRDAERRLGADTYGKVEAQWDLAVESLAQAVALYRKAGVPDGSWLPYRALLMIPAIAHARGHKLAMTQWMGWAIAASLWGHYASSSETRAQTDAQLSAAGKLLELFDHVKQTARRPESILPDDEDFLRNVPQESGVMLALLVYLARTGAQSIPSGRLFKSHAEPVEVHPLFPRSELDRLPWRDSSHAPERLGNLTLLYRSDAQALCGRAPEEYLPTVDRELVLQHGIPSDPALWTARKYDAFCVARERASAKAIIDLLRSYGVP